MRRKKRNSVVADARSLTELSVEDMKVLSEVSQSQGGMSLLSLYLSSRLSERFHSSTRERRPASTKISLSRYRMYNSAKVVELKWSQMFAPVLRLPLKELELLFNKIDINCDEVITWCVLTWNAPW